MANYVGAPGSKKYEAYGREIEALFPDYFTGLVRYSQLSPGERRYWTHKAWRKRNLGRVHVIANRWTKNHSEQRRAEKLGHYVKNIELYRAQGRAYQKKNRQRVLELLGGQCACCRDTTEAFLQVDHIEPPPSHQALYGQALYLEVLRFPNPRDKFRLLCSNCNFATRRYRVCPHNQYEVNQFLTICQDYVGRSS